MSNYATKQEVRNVADRVTKLEFMFDVLTDKLDSILKVLVKIAWLIATPIVVGIGYAGIQAASQGLPW